MKGGWTHGDSCYCRISKSGVFLFAPGVFGRFVVQPGFVSFVLFVRPVFVLPVLFCSPVFTVATRNLLFAGYLTD